MADKVRWGILSTGKIAHKFAADLKLLPDAEIVAVGSRTQSAADAFSAEFAIPHRHTSYTALANDPDVDVVYIGTPHTLHHQNAMECLSAGKAVLCEKPFAINTQQAQQMIQLAGEKRLFLMEALWTRFLPALDRIRQLLAGGTLGEIRLVMADFGFQPPFDPASRLFAPELGGGALLDVGIYPIQLALMVLGEPAEIASRAHIGSTGVDEQAGVVFSYPGGKMAVLVSSIQLTTAQEAHIIGTQGRIRIPAQWWHPNRIRIALGANDEIEESFPHEGFGYQFEAAEVMACLRAGKLESDHMPLAETLRILRAMDALRAQWGLKYPVE